MEAMEMLYTRRSIRKYDGRPVEKEILDRVFSAALMAPSWKNTQTAGYIVALSQEKRQVIMDCLPEYNANTCSMAPVIVVMTCNTKRSGYERDGSYTTAKEDRWQNFDAGVACQTMCLAAREAGLGTCIMGIFDEAKLTAALEIPENQIITAVIPMGYPAMDPAAPKRKSLEERVSYV